MTDFDDLEEVEVVEGAEAETPSNSTLYAVAGESMEQIIKVYLELAKETEGFNKLKIDDLDVVTKKRIILGGIGSPLDPETTSAQEVLDEWTRMQSIPFSVEDSVTKGVYLSLRERVEVLLEQMQTATTNFTNFDEDYIYHHSYLLPVFQRLLNASSKSKLKTLVGNVSDNSISKPASKRIAAILNRLKPGRAVTLSDLKLSIEPTLEGIVRDLVGRVLLENVVANALDGAGVKYKRESEYSAIKGVVYDFRADFVMPDELRPLVFIEVRKSSSRHASLYAKDKMFSAINWKGQNKELMAILVTEGPWTEQTLKTMTKVFDYVVPLRKAPEIAEIVSAYLKGDKSKLRLLIDFAVKPTQVATP